MSQDSIEATIASLDAVNAGDPNHIDIDGVRRPKELVHAERMTEWVRRLDAHAGDAQLLAARGHHLRRWSLPRSDYPDGRAGYLRWRTELSKRHADETAAICAEHGVAPATVDRVREIVRKQGLGTDREVQVHEDALCLVFLELQFADLVGRLGRDKGVDVVAKTVRKMSPAGIAAAGSISMGEDLAAVLAEAVGRASTEL